MSGDSAAHLSLISRQQRQLLTETAAIRDGLGVLTAIVLRQDGTFSALLTEIRAMHGQHSRLANRVREIEAREV